MPKLLVDVPDTEHTFVRPAIIEIVRDLIGRTNFPKTEKIHFLGETHTVPTPGSTLDGDELSRSVSSDNAVTIEIEEDYNDIDITNMSYPDDSTPAIILDSSIGLAVRTIYCPVNYTIQMKFRFSSQSRARSWVQRHGIATRLGRTSLSHSFESSYPIPKSIVMLLKDIHSKASINHPEIGDIKTWLHDHISPRYIIATDQAAGRKSLMMTDSHCGAIGGFQFEKAPDPIRKLENNVYEAEITYKVRLEKPIFLNATFPVMAYNIPIDSIFTREDKQQSDFEENRREDQFLTDSRQFTKYMEWFGGSGEVVIPYYDDWKTSTYVPFSIPVLSLLAMVDPNDKKNLFNLRDILPLGSNEDDVVQIDPDILDFVAQFPDSAIQLYGSPLNVTVYKGRHPLKQDLVTLDNDLNLATLDDMDTKSSYHVVISLLYDMRTMRNDVYEGLRRSPDLFIKLCNILYPGLRDKMLSDPNDKDYWYVRTDNSLGRIGFKEILYRGAMLYRRKKIRDINIGKEIMIFTINSEAK